LPLEEPEPEQEWPTPGHQQPGGPTSAHRFNKDEVINALHQLLTTDRKILKEVAKTLARDRSDAGEAMFDIVLAVLSGQRDLMEAEAMDLLRIAREWLR
jgi:hypothetical protein